MGRTLALTGVVGGDHIIYVDFKQRSDLDARIEHATDKGKFEVVDNLARCRATAGIGVIDVSGHRITDALLAAMLHQAFLLVQSTSSTSPGKSQSGCSRI